MPQEAKAPGQVHSPVARLSPAAWLDQWRQPEAPSQVPTQLVPGGPLAEEDEWLLEGENGATQAMLLSPGLEEALFIYTAPVAQHYGRDLFKLMRYAKKSFLKVGFTDYGQFLQHTDEQWKQTGLPTDLRWWLLREIAEAQGRHPNDYWL